MKQKVIFLISCLACTMLAGCGQNDAASVNKTVSISIDTAAEITVSPQNENINNDTSVSCDNINTTSDNDISENEVYNNTGYCEFKNIETIDFQDISSKAVIYYPTNPVEYNKVVDANITFGEIAKAAFENGEKYTIPLSITVNQQFSTDNVEYSGCITPMIELCDDITGKVIPAKDTKGSAQYTSGITISENGSEYSIAYSCDVNITYGKWTLANDGSYYRTVTFNAVYNVEKAKDYEGLIIKISPCTSYRTYDSSLNDSNIKLLDDDKVDGTVYIKCDK